MGFPNEWFTLEIIARDSHIMSKVNDRVASESLKRKPGSQGHILLQQRGGQTAVEFRKIEIVELDEQGKPLHPQTSAEAVPLTIGMNDEFGMLCQGRLVAPAELGRVLDEALKENPDREVVVDLPKRKWTVAGHVDQLELIARIAGAKRITRPAWSETVRPKAEDPKPDAGAALTEEEVKSLVSAAAGVPRQQWATLGGDIKGPDTAAIEGTPLSLLRGLPKPGLIGQAIQPSQGEEYVSLLRHDRLCRAQAVLWQRCLCGPQGAGQLEGCGI